MAFCVHRYIISHVTCEDFPPYIEKMVYPVTYRKYMTSLVTSNARNKNFNLLLIFSGNYNNYLSLVLISTGNFTNYLI